MTFPPARPLRRFVAFDGLEVDPPGAFRRFKDRPHQNYPDLLPAW